MTWNSTDGNPNPGAVEYDNPGGAPGQVLYSGSLGNLTGRFVSLNVRVLSGSNVRLRLFTLSGSEQRRGEGAFVAPAGSAWDCSTLDISNPESAQFGHDPTNIVGMVVEGDRFCLRRALVHVLDNAFKFTRHDRHGHVRIVATGDQGDALIRVSDDGAGVDQDRLSAIFEPFVQGRPPLGQRPRGLGLGLTIVRQVVEHHGGSVRAKSAGAGRGCEIQIRLPRAPDISAGLGLDEGGPRAR